MQKILVTGAFGLVGSDLVLELQKKHGQDNIIALGRQTIDNNFQGILEQGDVRDRAAIENLVKKYDVGTIYHLAGLLSVGGEKQPSYWDGKLWLEKHLGHRQNHQESFFGLAPSLLWGPRLQRKRPQHTFGTQHDLGVTKGPESSLSVYFKRIWRRRQKFALPAHWRQSATGEGPLNMPFNFLGVINKLEL
jgi:hypothetical protein